MPGNDAESTLRAIRRRRGLTLGAVAGRAGFSTSYLSMLERGERKLRRLDHITALAAVLRVPPSELAGEEILSDGEWATRGGLPDRRLPEDCDDITTGRHARLADELTGHMSRGDGYAAGELLKRMTRDRSVNPWLLLDQLAKRQASSPRLPQPHRGSIRTRLASAPRQPENQANLSKGRGKVSATATEPAPAAASPTAPAVPSFLELEITQFCQLKCSHCYSNSGPDAGRGIMTPDDWQRLMDEAAAIGIETVQFIGGEPTLDPDLPRLARYALGTGLNVDIYTNLVHVTPDMWELFTTPRVSVGFSWYSADPAKHAEVTGSRASHARTRANIAEAVRRGVRLRAGIVEVVEGQDIDAAMDGLRALGVTAMHADRSRGIGRAAHGKAPAVSELCGRCGKGRAAIGMDGQLTPCVLGRFLVAGNVRDTPLGDLFAADRWREILATVPPRDACVTCQPADNQDCDPSRRPPA